MKLRDMGFREYYHNYVVVEADALTEECSSNVSVKERDCFLLCSSYINAQGQLRFNVLSIGQEWQECDKGLGDSEMLGEFSPERLAALEARNIIPTMRMIEKNRAFLKKNYAGVSRNLMETRENRILDKIRDDFEPDIVKVGFVCEEGIQEYGMKLCRFDGPFAEGVLMEDAEAYPAGTFLRALPYPFGNGGEQRLLVVFAGPLSEEDRIMYKRIRKLGERAGISLSAKEEQEWN
jgi:hypothetical protein